MNEQTEDSGDHGAAFQKIWLESMTKLMQAACTFTPNSTPPELMHQIRNGIFQALSESWNEFLRSPQFQENMKQWMDNAIAFRKMSNDFMSKVRKEMQAPAREDIDTILLNVRHMENRILDRIETLSNELEALKRPSGAARTPARQNKPRNGARRSTAARRAKAVKP